MQKGEQFVSALHGPGVCRDALAAGVVLLFMFLI